MNRSRASGYSQTAFTTCYPAAAKRPRPAVWPTPPPVGGGQRRARVALLLDKGLHEQRAVAVAAPELVRQTAKGERERLGGEIPAAHAGTDQEAAQANHAMQLAGAGVGIPADERVARGQSEGGGGEADGPQHAVLGDQQVAQLDAGVLDRSARVLLGDHSVPQLQLAAVADSTRASSRS